MPAIALLAGLTMAGAARAEGPMLNDDAGTLGPGKFKVEGFGTRLHDATAKTLMLGYGPLPTLEVDLGGTRLTDGALPKIDGQFVSLKWVPYTQGEVTAGARLDHERAKSAGVSANATTLVGLLTWRSERGTVLHFNAGRSKPNSGSASNFGGIGAELPLGTQAQLTLDLVRDTSARVNTRQIGGRVEVVQGLKLYAASAKASGSSWDTTLGFNWEF